MQDTIQQTGEAVIKKNWGQPWITLISINSGASPTVHEAWFTPKHTFINTPKGGGIQLPTTEAGVYNNYIS